MLELREIEAFLAVAAELHFGRAAESLRLTTSRVSQMVRALERQIGAPLFERTSRRVRLTPLGEELLTGLRPAYERLGELLHEAQRSAATTGSRLAVGFSASLLPGIQQTLTGAFEHDRPGNRLIGVDVNRWTCSYGTNISTSVWTPS
jgi:DNA-binding transcriptional LysR family regulator